MYFTEAKRIEYERMMKQTPGFDRMPIKTSKERDCKHYQYYDDNRCKCSKEKCVVFDD